MVPSRTQKKYTDKVLRAMALAIMASVERYIVVSGIPPTFATDLYMHKIGTSGYTVVYPKQEIINGFRCCMITGTNGLEAWKNTYKTMPYYANLTNSIFKKSHKFKKYSMVYSDMSKHLPYNEATIENFIQQIMTNGQFLHWVDMM